MHFRQETIDTKEQMQENDIPCKEDRYSHYSSEKTAPFPNY
jgi:hypothetical protein